MKNNELKPTVQIIINAIDEQSDRIKEISLYIYNNPESANKEYLAAKMLTDELEKQWIYS